MRFSKEHWLLFCDRMMANQLFETIRDVNHDLGINNTYLKLLQNYSGNNRHYHNIDHIDNGLTAIDEIRHLARDPEALEMAWWWHDYIYDTKSFINEFNSVIAMKTTLLALGVTREFRHIVTGLILATMHDYIPTDIDQRFIVDIDLMGLGSSPEIFDLNTAKIRKEYSRVSDEDFKKGRAEFFRKFLASRKDQPIYLTDYFREKYELQAQENLRRFLETG
jgi:predicted metal-dependent HD superfamily phosphohydrolase